MKGSCVAATWASPLTSAMCCGRRAFPADLSPSELCLPKRHSILPSFVEWCSARAAMPLIVVALGAPVSPPASA